MDCFIHTYIHGGLLELNNVWEESIMIDLPYSLVIEATKEPNCFGFCSTDLEGFSGIGHSVEDCLYKAKWGHEGTY